MLPNLADLGVVARYAHDITQESDDLVCPGPDLAVDQLRHWDIAHRVSSRAGAWSSPTSTVYSSQSSAPEPDLQRGRHLAAHLYRRPLLGGNLVQQVPEGDGRTGEPFVLVVDEQ